MKSKYGVCVFRVTDSPVGTGVFFDTKKEKKEGDCCKTDCSQNAVKSLEMPISYCSPFGSNIAFLYEEPEDRIKISISVCDDCFSEQKNGTVFLIDESLPTTILSHNTFTSITRKF